MSSRCTLIAAVLGAAWSLVACSKAAAPAAEPEGEKPAPPKAAASAAPDTPAASPVAEPAGSAPSAEDIPAKCNFRVKGFCFEAEQDACAAASCAAGKCLIMESHPARVKCAD